MGGPVCALLDGPRANTVIASRFGWGRVRGACSLPTPPSDRPFVARCGCVILLRLHVDPTDLACASVDSPGKVQPEQRAGHARFPIFLLVLRPPRLKRLTLCVLDVLEVAKGHF